MNWQWQEKPRSASDTCRSPNWILHLFKTFFDPCPPNPKFDGLKIAWKKYNYVNPPYSNKRPWIEKAIIEMEKGNTTVMLLPHDSSTVWYHDLVIPNAEVLAFRGKPIFDDGHQARYPSILVVFHPFITPRVHRNDRKKVVSYQIGSCRTIRDFCE